MKDKDQRLRQGDVKTMKTTFQETINSIKPLNCDYPMSVIPWQKSNWEVNSPAM
jgi:hypothetical protein